MDYFGPILRTPRVLLSEHAIRRSGSLTPGTYLGGRRSSIVSAHPRSRSSFGCTMSDIGRDGSLVTRQISSSSASPLYSRTGLSFHPGASFTQRTFPGRERSFSIGPATSRWPVTRSDSWDLSSSPVRSRTSYQHLQQQPHHHSPASRLARRDSFSQPYYTVNSGGSGVGGVVLKRTSLYGSQFPLGGTRTASLSSPERKVLAESNVVSRRTSVQSKGKTPYVSQATRTSISQRGSLSSLPPAPVRKISVVTKPVTSNGPRSSIEVVELENASPPRRREVFETQTQPTRHGDFFDDLRKRTLAAKDRLGKHRMLLDRYLPVKLGPETEVAFEIQNKYGELVERLPFIERRTVPTDGETEEEQTTATTTKTTIIKPYTPATNIKSRSGSLHRARVPSSFTPTISETRKRARDVLCRVKNDPHYFNYNV